MSKTLGIKEIQIHPKIDEFAPNQAVKSFFCPSTGN